jgi:hypothetical protein
MWDHALSENSFAARLTSCGSVVNMLHIVMLEQYEGTLDANLTVTAWEPVTRCKWRSNSASNSALDDGLRRVLAGK